MLGYLTNINGGRYPVILKFGIRPLFYDILKGYYNLFSNNNNNIIIINRNRWITNRQITEIDESSKNVISAQHWFAHHFCRKAPLFVVFKE